jgi:succinyl-CoA synthetase alpha subunit
MADVHARIFANTYRDSVELMRIAAEIEALPGIVRAGLVMATPANRMVLATARLLSDDSAAASANDLVVAVSADDAEAADRALDLAASRLSGRAAETETATAQAATTLAEAATALGGANLALISTPGTYAAAEALKALKRGMNVFLFSDNVAIEDEIELKSVGIRKGLLVMGPDCGTAILDGVPLGFANAVRRGTIGLVAASGTGLQQVSCLIDRFGGGVSQAIGVGGRDLDERVGGAMMLAGIDRLAADPATNVIVLISKPPAASVAARVLEATRNAGKPVVVNFLGGDPEAAIAVGATPAATFEAAATAAVQLAGASGNGGGIGTTLADDPAAPIAADAIRSVGLGRWRIRGLYSGGSLAGETKLLLKERLGAERAHDHEVIDLGDDEYTVGRPHPMIDPRLRNEHLHAAIADPETAVVLLDVVLGYGSNADPAGAIVGALDETDPAARGAVAVVASVCGTDSDPQGRSAQEATLRAAGVLLAASNAQAARLAADIASRLAEPMTAAGSGA